MTNDADAGWQNPPMGRVTRAVACVPYGGGKSLDVYRAARTGLPVLLLWHGSGPNERDALSTIAQGIAARGALCLVPDWQSDDVAIGRQNLLDSISFARQRGAEFGGDAERISLCGWSLGANAAADVVLHPAVIDGWRPESFVGIAGGYDRSPITDAVITDGMTSDAHVRCLFIHGSEDGVVDVQRSRDSHQALLSWGWDSALMELDTDHAGIIGTRYDRDQGRCVVTVDSARAQAGNVVAGWVFAHIDSL